MPIVIQRKTGEVLSKPYISSDQNMILHRAAMAAEAKLHPERFEPAKIPQQNK